MGDMMGGGDTLNALVLVFVAIASLAGALVTGILLERYRVRTASAATHDAAPDAITVLDRRLAAGEIDEDAYLRARSAIES